MKAVYITPEGKTDVINFTVEEFGGKLRELIGGPFDCIALPNLGIDIWVHDEGLLLEMERNFFAEALWNAEHRKKDAAYIVGPIVLTGIADSDGNVTSISQNFLDKVIKPSVECGGIHEKEMSKE